jgi:hypothetical protein
VPINLCSARRWTFTAAARSERPSRYTAVTAARSFSGKAPSVAEAAYRNFIEQLARRMGEGRRFRDHLPVEVGADDRSDPVIVWD